MSELVQLGGVPGHLARPKGNGSWPALIVIQEWWGLSDHIKSVADRFASVGYLVFAPDLYHGELAKLGDHDAAMKLTQKYGSTAVSDLQKVFDALKKDSNCNGKVGSVGFCFGGRMSLALGISRPVDAVCVFYGGGMQQLFDQLGNLHAPVLGMFGDKDQSIPVGTVRRVRQTIRQARAWSTKSLFIQTPATPSSAITIRIRFVPKQQRTPGSARQNSSKRISIDI